jgi:hypothetical protein
MDSRGMNIPLIKTRGNLTRDEIIMMLEGILDGGAESIKPNDEKQAEARTKPRRRVKGWIMPTPMSNPNPIGSKGIMIPNMKDASISPRMMVVMDMGVDISLSRVCTWASHGAIMGETAVAVKNTVIPIKPDMRNSGERFRLPMKKARKRNNGIKKPKMITGPLR